MNPVSIQSYETFQEFSLLIISQMLIKYKKYVYYMLGNSQRASPFNNRIKKGGYYCP